jgi:catechol 2,3-dioxygenase-like lactoylglutathione lyase family enzyme
MSEAELAEIPAVAPLKPGLLKQLSHLAVRTERMPEIRRFYEDFLGLPMVTSLVAEENPADGALTGYIHCFFQLADSSCIAFFQIEKGLMGDPFPRTSDALEHHVALRVDDKASVDAYAERARAFGMEPLIIDHEDFYSVYMPDPDGEMVEVTWHKPSVAEIIDPVAAHRILDDWLAAHTN